jgi:LDH2 family malate/lactate/ureidoglycolate dehydrogenase
MADDEVGRGRHERRGVGESIGFASTCCWYAALDIKNLAAMAEFNTRMEQLIAELNSVPLAKGFDEVVYPGELEAGNDGRNRREGPRLPDDMLMRTCRRDRTGNASSLRCSEGRSGNRRHPLHKRLRKASTSGHRGASN